MPIPGAVMWAAGAIVCLGGAAIACWGWRGDRPRGRRRCPACWHELGDIPTRTCPECGREAQRERDLSRPRRRPRIAAIAAIATAAVVLGPPAHRVAHFGWWSLAPDAVLIRAVGEDHAALREVWRRMAARDQARPAPPSRMAEHFERSHLARLSTELAVAIRDRPLGESLAEAASLGSWLLTFQPRAAAILIDTAAESAGERRHAALFALTRVMDDPELPEHRPLAPMCERVARDPHESWQIKWKAVFLAAQPAYPAADARRLLSWTMANAEPRLRVAAARRLIHRFDPSDDPDARARLRAMVRAAATLPPPARRSLLDWLRREPRLVILALDDPRGVLGAPDIDAAARTTIEAVLDP